LIVTPRADLRSFPRYTSPIPPAPSGETISYGPSFVPAPRLTTSTLHETQIRGVNDVVRCSHSSREKSQRMSLSRERVHFLDERRPSGDRNARRPDLDRHSSTRSSTSAPHRLSPGTRKPGPCRRGPCTSRLRETGIEPATSLGGYESARSVRSRRRESRDARSEPSYRSRSRAREPIG
jgi:hypothetical protein